MLTFPLPILSFTAAFKHGPRQAYAIRILRQAIAEALLSDKEAAGVQDDLNARAAEAIADVAARGALSGRVVCRLSAGGR